MPCFIYDTLLPPFQRKVLYWLVICSLKVLLLGIVLMRAVLYGVSYTVTCMPLLGWSEKGNCLSSKETAEYLKKKRKREGNILYNTKKRTLELLKQKMIWITTSLQSTWVCNLASEIPWRLFYNLAAKLAEKKNLLTKQRLFCQFLVVVVRWIYVIKRYLKHGLWFHAADFT